MTAALAESPLSFFAEAGRQAPAGGPRLTLEERLDSTWRALRSNGAAECPVCHTAMRLDHGVGRCSGCGSTLS
jgi:ribosomal protein L37AE/L43A